MTQSERESHARCMAALNKVAKWRNIFTGMQLGTRPKTDPVCRAVRDQRELLIMLRVELSAVANLLMKKGVITRTEWQDQMTFEADLLDASFEQLFPGIRATKDGIELYDLVKAAETMKGWPP